VPNEKLNVIKLKNKNISRTKFFAPIHCSRRPPCRLKFTPFGPRKTPQKTQKIPRKRTWKQGRRVGFAHPPPQTSFTFKKYKILYNRH
jgi:hypothetical protein